MIAQVNQIFSFRHGANCGFDDGACGRHKGDDGSIVITVDVPVQNYRAVNCFDCAGDTFNCLALAAFAEVWYTLDQR